MRIEDYPEASWRPHQKQYSMLVRAVANQAGEVRVGLEGPCGSGKSLGYLRAVLDPACPPSQVLSTTRAHLTQIEETLETHYPGGDWAIIRGRSHYACCNGQAGHAGLQRAKRQAESIATVEDADPESEWAEPSQGNKCPMGDKCGYRLAVIKAGKAKVVVQCTIGALYRKSYWAELDLPPDATEEQKEWVQARKDVVNRELVVLDEAHEFLGVRRSFETIEGRIFLRDFNPEYAKALNNARQEGNYTRSYVLLSEEENWPLRDHMVKEYEAQMSDEWLNRKRPARRMTEAEWGEAKEKVKAKLRARIDMLTSGSHEGDARMRPVVSVQWSGTGAYEKVHLVQEPLFAAVGQKLARVEVFTSATLARVAPLLKIESVWLKKFPEIFDWTTNVTPNPLPDPDPGRRSNVAISETMVEQIYQADGRPTTIALFVSKFHTNSATKLITGKPGVFIQGKDGDLQECLEKVRKYGPGAFLATYGGWVGTDIPGSKWLLIGSASKSPKATYHDARQERGFGNAWDDREKQASDCLKLAQGLGRALRTAEDQAVILWQDTQAFRDLGLNAKTARQA